MIGIYYNEHLKINNVPVLKKMESILDISIIHDTISGINSSYLFSSSRVNRGE